MSQVVLVDATTLAIRSFFAVPAKLVTPAGLHTNALYGLTQACRRVLSGALPEHAIAVLDRVKALWHVVAQHGQWLELDDITVAELVVILGREVAIDSAPNTVALRTDPDRFRYFDPAILHHRNIAVKVEDALVSPGQQRQRQQ